jgi:alkanesulfonate monooxygenase SsuD/methylene tetrahydromethanopterin reductase-like flavin-dependent oxidoreductase (luciferase family)
MLDHLSQGRLEFGAGLGTHEHEFMRWNLDFAERREMGAEAMDIILKSWSGESVTHQGKFWSYDEALPTPRPFQQPHPPIWYASHSVASLEYAAEHNFNVSQNLDTDEVIAEKFQLFRDSWKQWGHPGPMPRTFLMRAVHVAETDEIARAEAERPLLEADGLGSRGIAETRIGFRGNPDVETRNARARGTREQRATYDWWVDTGVAIIGSPDTVIKKLKEHRASIGYDLFAANHRFGAMASEAALKSLKLFGEEVIPAFA